MLKIENLSFGYRKNKNIYENLSLELNSGKIYGMLGVNGSGKTTLLNIISTLLVNYKGTVALDDFESKKRNRKYLKEIFHLPEIIEKDNFKVKELIEMGKNYENWNEDKFLNFLKDEDVNINKKLKFFSKGWRKKIWFYYAISINPKVLILDEVSEGIDIISQNKIIKNILEYSNENKIVLIASHHIKEFEEMIDEIIIIDNGKILYKGEKGYIKENYGWIESTYSNEIDKENIVLEKDLLGEKFIVVKNIKKYSNVKHKNIDIATFFEVVIKLKGEIQL